MIRSTIIYGVAMILYLTSIPNAIGEKCERLAKYDSFEYSSDIESDLTNSVWNITEGDGQATF